MTGLGLAGVEGVGKNAVKVWSINWFIDLTGHSGKGSLALADSERFFC